MKTEISNAQHTPDRPYEVRPHVSGIGTTVFRILENGLHFDSFATKSQADAECAKLNNAHKAKIERKRIEAAAPELLAALEASVLEMDDTLDHLSRLNPTENSAYVRDLRIAIAQSRAAISKARGGVA